MYGFLSVVACLFTIAWPLSSITLSGKRDTGLHPIVEQSEQKGAANAPAVLLCGTGVSPHYESMVDQLLDALTERKIAAATSEGHAFARSTCLDKTREAGAGALLYIVANVSEKFARETKLSVQCVTSDGKKLWEEEVKGPLMSTSVSSTVKGITEKMKTKLQAHIGQEGIPVL